MHYDVRPGLPSAPAPLHAAPPAARAGSARARVLIVEDEALNRKLFRDLLRAGGYDVICAADGFEGLSAYQRHAPDLVLVDVQLPGIGGAELARTISADPGAPPVLAISAFAGPEDAARLREAGCADCLPKPVAIAEFAQRIGRALEGGRR